MGAYVKAHVCLFCPNFVSLFAVSVTCSGASATLCSTWTPLSGLGACTGPNPSTRSVCRCPRNWKRWPTVSPKTVRVLHTGGAIFPDLCEDVRVLCAFRSGHEVWADSRVKSGWTYGEVVSTKNQVCVCVCVCVFGGGGCVCVYVCMRVCISLSLPGFVSHTPPRCQHAL